ncbi:hypothetical protein APA_4514 [Pseudanabaena sp. lw0831]|nr:hypothetical protein APA_4514 [Pseudanabaena sp. lw0831]
MTDQYELSHYSLSEITKELDFCIFDYVLYHIQLIQSGNQTIVCHINSRSK